MKRILILVMCASLSLSMMALSTSRIRTHARFLSDRMAYELDLTPSQYDDVYEVNYDFIFAINRIMDDVVYGYYDAVEMYYTLLDERNEDMSYILTFTQYRKFESREYFYRPVYTSGSRWAFRIYTIYPNRSFFYYDRPTIYLTYHGAHSHYYYSGGYYVNRYYYPERHHYVPIRHNDVAYNQHRRNDFGSNIVQRGSTVYNRYSNDNSRNRTSDQRYQNDSGNTNAPAINRSSTTNNSRTGISRGSNTTTTTTTTTTNRTNNNIGRVRDNSTSTGTSTRRSTTTTDSGSSHSSGSTGTTGTSDRSTGGGRR